MTRDHENQTFFITGASGLLGLAFTRYLIDQNAQVVATDTHINSLVELKEELDDEGKSRLHIFEMDINNGDSIDEVMKKGHAVDALINCAYPKNKAYGAQFEDVTYQSFCENLSLNLGGHFLICQKMAQYFRQKGGGNIVNIASIYGVIPPKFDIYQGTSMTMPVEYAVIKSGLIQLTKYLACYYKGKNLRANCLSPGGILDNQDEKFVKAYGEQCLSKGLLDASDLFEGLSFLLSSSSQYMNGQNLIIDDGFTL